MSYLYTTDQAVAEQFKAALDEACGYNDPAVQAATLTTAAVQIITGPDEDQWLVPMPDSIMAHGENAPALDPMTMLPEERQQDEPLAAVEEASAQMSMRATQASNRPVRIGPDGEPVPLEPDPNNFVLVTEECARDLGFWPDDTQQAEPPSGGSGPIKGGLMALLLLALPCWVGAAVLQFDAPVQTSPCVRNIYTAPVGSTNWTLAARITTTNWWFDCTNAIQIRVTTQLHDPRHTIKEPEPESPPSEVIVVEPFCWRKLE